jgi:hypothetical protein
MTETPASPHPDGSDLEPAVDADPTDLTQEAAAETPSELWTSDAALSFQEARRLTSRRGATFVMLVGEVRAGKTTLLVELWTDLLLRGSLGRQRLAGSTTALAFEERSFESRLESGQSDTLRTNPEDDGLLHLVVADETGQRTEILLADVTGEHFRSIRQGRPFDDEFNWIGRVDRFLVLVDGALVGGEGTAEIAYTRTQRLLLGLRESSARFDRGQVALVITKDDKIIEAGAKDAFAAREQALHAMAREIDPDAPLFRVAARPGGGAAPYGLAELIDWLSGPLPRARPREPVLPESAREMGRIRV